MSDEEKDVKPAEEQEESSESSSEEKGEKKVLNRDPSESKDWDDQEEVAAKEEKKDESEESEESSDLDDEQVVALEKEKKRVSDKREKIKQELKEMRKANKNLSAEKQVLEETAEETEEGTDADGWQRVDKMLEEKVKLRTEAQDFYAKNPNFYDGEDGKKNRQLLEEYVKTHFRTASNQARQMAHQAVFGEFERDQAVRQAETKQKSKLFKAQVASLGSGSGKTSLEGAKKPRKRIIPKEVTPDQWY